MISHVSMPADDCRRVADVLAAMLNGRALPFPRGGRRLECVATDHAFRIVVTPRGRVVVPGPTEHPAPRHSAVASSPAEGRPLMHRLVRRDKPAERRE
jgi:hypothetical protein